MVDLCIRSDAALVCLIQRIISLVRHFHDYQEVQKCKLHSSNKIAHSHSPPFVTQLAYNAAASATTACGMRYYLSVRAVNIWAKAIRRSAAYVTRSRFRVCGECN